MPPDLALWLTLGQTTLVSNIFSWFQRCLSHSSSTVCFCWEIRKLSLNKPFCSFISKAWILTDITQWHPRVATYHPLQNSLTFHWFSRHFTVFHTLWQIKKMSFLFFTLMVLTLSLQIWRLLLRKEFAPQGSKFFSSRVAPNAEGDGLSAEGNGLRQSHENVHPFPSWTE